MPMSRELLHIVPLFVRQMFAAFTIQKENQHPAIYPENHVAAVADVIENTKRIPYLRTVT